MGEGARVVISFYKESKSEKKCFGKGRVLGGGGRWSSRRICPNQFAPSTSLKLGAYQCINV